MKTAVTVLQEMMMKKGLMPEYECIAQTGPQHQALFEYRCLAFGKVVSAAARSKKEAKQEVARLMLQALATSGHPVPPPFGLANPPSSSYYDDSIAHPPADTRSYVALLKELCTEYRLNPVEYELVGDTGPPHLRHFTVRASIGQHVRLATSTTKKAARQLAAEKLYSYLRENLARVTRDFSEEEALARAHDKAMERYQETDEFMRRPDLGQKISEYNTGITSQLNAEQFTRVSSMVEGAESRVEQSPERVLNELAQVIRLDLSWSEIERHDREPITILEVAGTSPELAFSGESRAEACCAAVNYVRLALANTSPPSPSITPPSISQTLCDTA